MMPTVYFQHFRLLSQYVCWEVYQCRWIELHEVFFSVEQVFCQDFNDKLFWTRNVNWFLFPQMLFDWLCSSSISEGFFRLQYLVKRVFQEVIQTSGHLDLSRRSHPMIFWVVYKKKIRWIVLINTMETTDHNIIYLRINFSRFEN